MRKVFRVALGITTGIGGFLDAGALATAAQAGARFRFGLIWAILIGTICVMILMEMAGRLAIVSGHALRDAIHERFGFTVSFGILAADVVLDILILGSEIGGVSVALQLISGIGFRWWAIPVGIVVWLLLWLGAFSFIEQSVSLLGLITLAFVLSAFKLHPLVGSVISGLVPSLHVHNSVNYWYTAVAIIGAILSPYMLYFYSSGAIEDELDESALTLNRVVAMVGMLFGCVIAVGVLVTSSVVLGPRHVHVQSYAAASGILDPVFGHAGLPIFVACLAIASFGAAVEVSLATAYVVAQSFGWNWSQKECPGKNARFSLTYSVAIVLGTALVLSGLNPFTLTVFTMAATCLTLPAVTFPFLALMNDEHYLKGHTNSPSANVTVFAVVAVAFVLAIISIPLQIFGS